MCCPVVSSPVDREHPQANTRSATRMMNSRPDNHLSQRAHRWRIAPAHTLAVAVVCWISFAVVLIAVTSGQSESMDRVGLLLWQDGAMPASKGLLEGMRDLTALGGVWLRNLVGLGAITALLFRRMRQEALLLAGTIISGWMVNTALKLAVGRPRPSIVPHLTQADGYSFPSGHSFNSALVYIAIGLAFAAISSQRRVRWTLIGGAIVLSLSIAFTRVWLGVHYPSDVLAGWLGGAGWAFMASTVLHKPPLPRLTRL